MWKDFFYYSKGERRAVILLIVLIVLILGLQVVIPFVGRGVVAEGVSRDSFAEMDSFLAGIREMEVKRVVAYSKEKSSRREVVLSPFDPNSADSIELSRLGLPSFIVRNVLKYRQAGGRFQDADAFSRIYGLTEEQFALLRPYIRIAEVFRRKKDTLRRVKMERRDTLVVYKYPEGTLVELNSADTAELKKIPGIGSGIARAIVAYRTKLGGYYELPQLREATDNVTPDMLKWFKLEKAPFHRINVNKTSLDRLRAHPYLNFYQAKVIVEYRRKKGRIKSLSQLSLYEEFTGKDLERLSHYLAFD